MRVPSPFHGELERTAGSWSIQCRFDAIPDRTVIGVEHSLLALLAAGPRSPVGERNAFLESPDTGAEVCELADARSDSAFYIALNGSDHFVGGRLYFRA